MTIVPLGLISDTRELSAPVFVENAALKSLLDNLPALVRQRLRRRDNTLGPYPLEPMLLDVVRKKVKRLRIAVYEHRSELAKLFHRAGQIVVGHFVCRDEDATAEYCVY